MSRPVKPSLGCGYAVTVFIALLGGVALLAAAQNHRDHADATGIPPAVWVPAAIGIALLVAARAYLGFARRTVRAHADEERIRAENPDAPWLWQHEWRGPRIACEASKGAGTLWFFAIFWNALSLPGLIHIVSDHDREPAALLILLFPVVGIGLLASAAYQTLRRHKYGRVRFTAVSLPGLVGGHLGGVVEIPARVVPLGDLRLSLRCIRRTITGSGKNRRVSESTLWESEQRIPPEKLAATINLTTVPVLFEIPAGQPATDLDVSSNQILWRLSAEAETPGVDFLARFHVPVFPAGGPGLAAPLPAASSAAPAPAPLHEAELARHGVARLADGWGFTAPHLRTARLVTTLIFVGLLALFGVLVALAAHPVAFGMTGFSLLVVSFFAYDFWHARSEIRLVGDQLVLTRSVWFRPRQTRLPLADVADIRIEPSIYVGAHQYHRLVLVGRPVGRQSAAAHPREPFATRKLRHRLARAAATEQPELQNRLAAAPSFEERFAGHLPGPSLVENIRHEIFARLTG